MAFSGAAGSEVNVHNAIIFIAAYARFTGAIGIFDLIRYLSQSAKNRHSREGGNPVHSCADLAYSWIPAFAGMTDISSEARI